MRSDCCGKKVEWGVDTKNTYTFVSGYGGLTECGAWICPECSKVYIPKEGLNEQT